MSGSSDHTWQEAVGILQQAGLIARLENYGLSVVLQDTSGSSTGACGVDNDFSISMSVRVPGSPTCWVFRPTVADMVEFLIRSNSEVQSNPQRTWHEIICRDAQTAS
ncbi:MAG: hypothetical protein KatS3mg057_2345 [Herpetosiphonaceae bacterium]|nr:MAG: hypothetical protein KatS3mg057_2345 [Herpetosiphonaceae bacterium]